MVRPVCLCVVAIAVVAVVMAFEGWKLATAVLAAVLAGISGLLVYQVHRAVSRLRAQSGTVRRAAEQAEQHYVEVLCRVVRFVEARDKFNVGHSERVADLCVQIARRMHLPPGLCERLRIAGRVHDLGMIAIPEKLLVQPGRLGVDGYRCIKEHPEVGHEVLQPLQSLADVLPAVRHHHERMNGTGYPSGLSGDQIPLVARIVAVADAYDAMTHDRPHRSAMTAMAAMRELRRCSPAGYDEAVVNALAAVKNLASLEKAMAGA